MRRIARALLFTCLCATAQAQPFAGIASVVGETDADGFSAIRLRAGALFDYQSAWRYFGVAAQENLYSQSGWHENAHAVLGFWRDQNRDTLSGVNVEAGVIQVGGHTRPIGDMTWNLQPTTDTTFEFLGAAGLVETQPAIEQGIGYTFWGVAAEQKLTDRVTAVALAGYQPYTDGNARTHFRARLIWDALPEEGVNLQARWRSYRDSETDVGGAYFNPQTYNQWMGVVGFRKKLAGWTTTGAVGAGQEHIQNSGTTTQPTYLAEVRAEGPVAGDARLALQAAYNRSAGFSNSPDYWWGLVSVVLIVPF